MRREPTPAPEVHRVFERRFQIKAKRTTFNGWQARPHIVSAVEYYDRRVMLGCPIGAVHTSPLMHSELLPLMHPELL